MAVSSLRRWLDLPEKSSLCSVTAMYHGNHGRHHAAEVLAQQVEVPKKGCGSLLEGPAS